MKDYMYLALATDDGVRGYAAATTHLVEEARQRRRLTPQAVTHLDWHNDMSKLILDINERIEAAADERARAVIIRILTSARLGSCRGGLSMSWAELAPQGSNRQNIENNPMQ